MVVSLVIGWLLVHLFDVTEHISNSEYTERDYQQQVYDQVHYAVQAAANDEPFVQFTRNAETALVNLHIHHDYTGQLAETPLADALLAAAIQLPIEKQKVLFGNAFPMEGNRN